MAAASHDVMTVKILTDFIYPRRHALGSRRQRERDGTATAVAGIEGWGEEGAGWGVGGGERGGDGEGGRGGKGKPVGKAREKSLTV